MTLNGLRIFSLISMELYAFPSLFIHSLVDKLFGRLSSFIFKLNRISIIFKFDLPLCGRKETLYTGSSVILLISQSIDSMWFK